MADEQQEQDTEAIVGALARANADQDTPHMNSLPVMHDVAKDFFGKIADIRTRFNEGQETDPAGAIRGVVDEFEASLLGQRPDLYAYDDWNSVGRMGARVARTLGRPTDAEAAVRDALAGFAAEFIGIMQRAEDGDLDGSDLETLVQGQMDTFSYVFLGINPDWFSDR